LRTVGLVEKQKWCI